MSLRGEKNLETMRELDSHVMNQPDLLVVPHAWMNRPLRLERIGPPWQRPPSAAERLGNNVLIGEFRLGHGRGGVEKMDDMVHGLLARLKDDHARVEQVRGARAGGVWDGRGEQGGGGGLFRQGAVGRDPEVSRFPVARDSCSAGG